MRHKQGNSLPTQRPMKVSPAFAPLQFVAIKIHGNLVRIPRQKMDLLVVLNRLSKPVRTVMLRTTTAKVVAKAFVTLWIMEYGHPRLLLFDNRKRFTSRFFQHVYKALSIENGFTMTYSLQTNGQVERYVRIPKSGLRHYVELHLKEWDMYTDTLKCKYNTLIHMITNCAPFELDLSQPTQVIVTQSNPEYVPREPHRSFFR